MRTGSGQRLKKAGKSQAGLARALGLDPSAVTRLLAGQRHIKAFEIPRIRAYFDEPDAGGGDGLSAELELAWPWRSGDTIPVLGIAEGGPDGIVEWNGEVVDNVPRPPFLSGAANAYAVYARGLEAWSRAIRRARSCMCIPAAR